ncbi:MAG: DoxX family protein [Gammaproteobacteria bacterium]
MDRLIAAWEIVTVRLDAMGDWLPSLFLRAILAWEYWEAGVQKLNGENWFGSIKDAFPFPFSVVPVELSWFIATWFEILGAIGLLLGLFTRFFSLSLIILTIVAALSVHWPDQWNTLGELWKGYAISDKGFGNFKLPLLFLIMLLPLFFRGAGKASLDYAIKKYVD